MATEDWCRCWRTTWEFDVMADGKGHCKHCTKPIAFYFVARKGERR